VTFWAGFRAACLTGPTWLAVQPRGGLDGAAAGAQTVARSRDPNADSRLCRCESRRKNADDAAAMRSAAALLTAVPIYPVNAGVATRVVGGAGGCTSTAPKSQFGLPESHRLSTICQLVLKITPPLWSATWTVPA
jgi:hypothetical protein